MTRQPQPKPRPYAELTEAQNDPLARPLTFAQVMARTGRSRRTISAWISQGLLNEYIVADGPRTIRVFVERQVLEVHREMNEKVAAARLNLRNQRARADAARPKRDPTPAELQLFVDVNNAVDHAMLYGTAPVDAEEPAPADAEDTPPHADKDGGTVDAPPADMMLRFALQDCMLHANLRVGVFEAAGTPTAFTQELVEEITSGVFGMVTARIPSGLRRLEFANGSRIEFYTVGTRLDATRRHASQLFHLVCLDSALPVDVQQFLSTRARGLAGSCVPVLGVRYSDCCTVQVQPWKSAAAGTGALQRLEDAEPTDVPPDVVQALSARMRPGYGPVPTVKVKVRGELDTSSLVASLREVGSAMADAADRLERINGTEVGTGTPAPANFRDPAVAEAIRDMRERNSAYTLRRARADAEER